jgi:hypothetical protein
MIRNCLNLFILGAVFVLSAGCSHKYGIKKAYAFSREAVAGAVQTTEPGQQASEAVRTVHLIYVETKAGEELPQWEEAWINERPFTLTAIEMDREVRPGTLKDQQEEVVIKAKPKNRLWQLLVQSDPANPSADADLRRAMEENRVVLTGKWKNEPFRFGIKNLQQLETVFHQ